MLKRVIASTAVITLALTGVSGAGPAFADEDASLLERQRQAFRDVYAEVERGNWQAIGAHRELLESYALWPDLRAAWFGATLANADHGDVEDFLDRHGMLRPARELRYRYALHLVETGRLDEFHAIYERFYQGLEIAKLDCLALQGEIAAGNDDRIHSRGLALWRIGKSQKDECDPVFANLREQGILTAAEYEERFALAVEERQFSLARYLARSLPAPFLDTASTWLEAQRRPLDFAGNPAARKDVETDRQQLAYAITRIAFRDPAAAEERWKRIRDSFTYDDSDRYEVERHIALWAARLHLPDSAEKLAAIPGAGANTETYRWLIRANLLRRDWSEVIRAIDSMQATESGHNEWQYWRAVALSELRDETAGNAIFTTLANERDYYGFLAADALDAAYELGDQSIADDEALAGLLQKNPALIRARELFFVGLESRGRSEWDAATSALTSDEQMQAALLAHQWGWHSRAISTVAAAGHFDDLEIRYPMPWQEIFDRSAESAGIRDSLAYGVARSESLFMRDIRSSAGAIGIMQLMPDTARSAARELSIPWTGRTTLTDTAANIRLGTHYLGQMLDRFDRNPVLATAAYNAGPGRVENWLPATGIMDARIWIENIPFNETRRYVRRVLSDDIIFNWRMTGAAPRLSELLVDVRADGAAAIAVTD
jgi:soluble lytic murein transglycosylase